MSSSGEFRKLLFGNFVSQTGSHFLTLALVSLVYAESGSPVQAAIVFVFSYLPSVILAGFLGSWVDRSISRKLLIGNDALAVILSVAAGMTLAMHLPLSVLCLVLGIRSILLVVGKSAATKWIKMITPPAEQGGRIKIFFLTFFLSTAISGSLAGIVLQGGDIATIIALDVFTYLISMTVSGLLKPLPVASLSPQSERPLSLFKSVYRLVFERPELRFSFALVIVSQAIFQGAYAVLVTYLPMQQFGLGLGGIGSFQVSASIGITIGFVLNWLYPEIFSSKGNSRSKMIWTVASMATMALILSAKTASPKLALLSFCAMNISYEVIWLYFSADFFRQSTPEEVASNQFVLTAVASFFMAVMTLTYSVAIQEFGGVHGLIWVLAIVGAVRVVGKVFSLSKRTTAQRAPA